MKISAELEAAINKQIQEELESAYLYLSMAGYFEDQDLPGFASWMKAQYQEELVHAHKFFDFLFEREGRAVVPSIKQPQKDWDSPLAAFQAAYKHEGHITKCIYDLVAIARKESDYASDSFLAWYVDEQVEEESTALAIVKKLERVSDTKTGLYMLDKEMSQRATIAS